MIAIIDYKAGNLTSVARAIRHLGFECRITNKAKEIIDADRVIFPGVGSAGQAMEDLKKTGLDQTIHTIFENGKPFLGICLGTQIILEESDENQTTCLGLLSGVVKRFPVPLLSDDGKNLKIPHMGWNHIIFNRPHPVFKGIGSTSEFYFVHSYFPAPRDRDTVIGTTYYGIPFASVISKRNLLAMQFHPEKSGSPGLTLLRNFCLWNGEEDKKNVNL